MDYQKNDHPKRLFISFHWRLNGVSSNGYLKNINELLNSKELKNLANSGINIWFLPHAKFMKHIKLFKVPSYIEVPIGKPFQDILVESDAIVTDFSSNSFEMAYMNKPSIIYVPGINQVRLSCSRYHIENLNYPHMTYCKTMKDVFDKIKDVFYKPICQEDTDIANKVFDRVDTDNTKRLVEWMLEHKLKDSEKRNKITLKNNVTENK